LLGSRLQKCNLLKENIRILVYLKWHEYLFQFYKMEGGLVACTDIDGLMQRLDINHNLLEWRLFTDTSNLSLKAVLLHYDNILPYNSVGHSVHNKQWYENMKILLKAINYEKFKCQICRDIKVIALLLGIKQGMTKFCCFICEWDIRFCLS